MLRARQKRSLIKWLLIGAFAFFLVGATVFFTVLPPLVAAWLNPTVNKPPYQVSENARRLHSELLVADLHCDALLWNRDLLEKSATGHVDLPRLREGNVALQVFSVVTKSPFGLNIEHNSGDSDTIFWLSLAQRQPLATLSSLTARAVNQAQRLQNFAQQSNDKFVIIKTKRDLAQFLERRQTEKDLVAGLLAVEGAHALDGQPENVDVLFDAGFRMMSPSHFFDSEMGGSAHGMKKYGLTEKGREMLRRMEAKSMILDLAHASAATIDDALKLTTRPVIVSHTGVRGTCDNNRNLTDDQLRGIAKTGGIVGIGFWETAICGTDAQAIARSIRYTANIIGADHVALGSDFDGSVAAAFDATGMALITEALMQENFTDDEIRQIMGGNVLRLLSENLPD